VEWGAAVIRLTYHDARRKGVFELLGDLFSDADSSQQLLEVLGVPASNLPPFGADRPAAYWEEVGRQISRGRFAFQLRDLLSAAAVRYPQHARLKALTRWQSEPAEVRILMLPGSPSAAAQTRLDLELRQLRAVGTVARCPMTLMARPVTRIADVVTELTETQPTIVHFSGADPDGRLLLDTDDQRRSPITVDQLSTLFSEAAELDCILLGSCFNEEYVEPLLRHAHAVVGSSGPLSDDAAVAFTRGFYTALVAGRNLETAYRYGLEEMELAAYPTDQMRLVRRQAHPTGGGQQHMTHT